MDPFKLLASAFKRLTTAITSPFRMMLVRFMRMFNINIITAKLIAPLTKKIKSLLVLRPKSKEDYVTVGRFWIFRKIFLTAVLVMCAGVFIYYSVYAPKLPAIVPAPSSVKTDIDFNYDDMDIRGFSGVANIMASDGQIIYTGDIDKGVCKGVGTLKNRDGKLLYEGEFDQNKYNGAGIQYYPDGKIHYEGAFAQNLYNGEGKLYDTKGKLMYEGTFKDGLYDGTGKEYSKEGNIAYEGGFSRGLYHGAGISYFPDGGLHFEGEFLGGLPSGMGTLYNNSGKAIYIGSMYKGEINYKSFVNATLADVEAAFMETPKVYYGDRDSCFLFPQAGIIVTTDCQVKVDVWEKPKTDAERAEDYYFMPDEIGVKPARALGEMEISNLALDPEIEVRTLSAYRSTLPIKDVSWFVPEGAESKAPAKEESSKDPMQDMVGGLIDKIDDLVSAQESSEETSSEEPKEEAPAEESDMPDFVDKNITLYFEIDKNVWQAESELDKTKVNVSKITVINPGKFEIPEKGGFDENYPPAIEDCVAIDTLRLKEPTVFSNILFEMDKQNKLFVRLKNISYAERIVQKTYNIDDLTYRCNYQLDDRARLMYYSIQQ